MYKIQNCTDFYCRYRNVNVKGPVSYIDPEVPKSEKWVNWLID